MHAFAEPPVDPLLFESNVRRARGVAGMERRSEGVGLGQDPPKQISCDTVEMNA